MRSQLAVAAARGTLVRNWQANPERLTETLADIAHDERVLGAAACAPDGTTLAATDAFPRRFSCAWVAAQMRAATQRSGRPELQRHVRAFVRPRAHQRGPTRCENPNRSAWSCSFTTSAT